MPNPESIPKTSTSLREDLPKEKSREELAELADQARGFKVTDKRTYLDAVVEKTERELALKRFSALSEQQKEDIIFRFFQLGDLPKPESSQAQRKNVVDIKEFREEKKKEGTIAQPVTELPRTNITPTETAPTTDISASLPRWRVKLDPFFDKVENLNNKIKAAKARDSLNINLSPLNPLGRGLHNAKEDYSPLRNEALALLKEFKLAAKIENMLAGEVGAKKEVRELQFAIEQEISKLKAELNHLENLRHPIHSTKNLVRSIKEKFK